MKTIVIVDDDLDDQFLLREALVEFEPTLELVSVYNGAQLFDLLESKGAYKNVLTSKPDLIVLDLNMPILDGVSILLALKQKSEISQIPVYVLTTSKDDGHRKNCELLGAKAFLTKASDLNGIQSTAGFLINQLNLLGSTTQH